jgi:hypothetical protein
MSYGIIRVQKFKLAGVRGIQIHDNRLRESTTNPDIDQERTTQNYTLVSCNDWTSTTKKRLDALQKTKAIRKDAVVMCQVMVTSDINFFNTLSPEKEKEFFNDAFNFVADRYGRENILSATIHKDEKTPHMHINLTPIRDGHLVANKIFDRNELRKLHTDYENVVGKKWGLDRGESSQEKRKHLDTEAFKTKCRIEEMRKEIEETKAELDKVKSNLSIYGEVRQETALALAHAQAHSIEKRKKAEKELEEEREKQKAELRALNAKKEAAAAQIPKSMAGSSPKPRM